MVNREHPKTLPVCDVGTVRINRIFARFVVNIAFADIKLGSSLSVGEPAAFGLVWENLGQKAKQLSAEKLYWVANGDIFQSLDVLGLEDWDEASLLDRKGFVRLRIDSRGTTVRWSVFSGNWSSLFFVMDWLLHQPTPITLQYYLVGWFSETVADPFTARERMHTIMAKSDVHLQSRTFVKPATPDKSTYIPDIIGDALEHVSVAPEHSVDLVQDPEDSRFKITRIGSESTIARLWGIEPVSYPCINGGSYDQIVSEVYPQVIQTGEAHYGHVYAAMSFPNSPIKWFPYQRVILPQRFADGQKGVTVLSAFSKVDISII